MRNKHVFLAAMLVTIGVGILSSCRGGFGSRHASEIRFDSIVVEQHIPLLLENDTTLPYSDIYVSYTYPTKFRDMESLARLQQIFQGTFFENVGYDVMAPEEAMEYYLDAYTEEYRSISNMFYEEKARLEDRMPSWYWYLMHHSNKILFQSDSLLSYAVEYSDYRGGAHGSYRITYTNIDLNELVTLTEEDIFIPGYFRQLTEKIVQQLMNDYEAEVPDSLLTRGFFTIEDIVPNNNFWLNEEGIHYSYNQYEIAPYSMGVIDVMVPYTELEDILISNGLVDRYFRDKN